MWLPLPTAQGYKGQALRVLKKISTSLSIRLRFKIILKVVFFPKTLTALSTPQEHTAFFFYCFSFKKLMVRSVAKQF